MYEKIREYDEKIKLTESMLKSKKKPLSFSETKTYINNAEEKRSVHAILKSNSMIINNDNE